MDGQPVDYTLDGVAHELGRGDNEATRHQHDGGEQRVQAKDGTIRGYVLPFQVVLQSAKQLIHLAPSGRSLLPLKTVLSDHWRTLSITRRHKRGSGALSY